MERHLESDEDIEQILRIAIQLPNPDRSLSLRERLSSAAGELGVTESQLAEAERRWAEQKVHEADVEAYIRENRAGFFAHLVPYILVNGFLIASSLGEREFWFLFPLVGWGFGLLAHYTAVFNRKSDAFRKSLAEWRKNKSAEAVDYTR